VRKTVFKETEAFFIDFDGTLADSMGLLYEIYCEFLERYGVKGCPEEFHFLSGPTIKEVVRYLHEKHKLPKKVEVLHEQYLNLMDRSYPYALKMFPGSKAFLDLAVSQGKLLAIVTSSTEEAVAGFLKKHELEDYFQAIVTPIGRCRAKPFPDVYVKALKILKVKPEFSMAVEDSRQGVQAAENAGIPTVQMLASSFRNPENARSGMHVDSWKELTKMIR
jgi:HAD superfamily hydrolase (TIGR01509 family)